MIVLSGTSIYTYIYLLYNALSTLRFIYSYILVGYNNRLTVKPLSPDLVAKCTPDTIVEKYLPFSGPNSRVRVEKQKRTKKATKEITVAVPYICFQPTYINFKCIIRKSIIINPKSKVSN